MTEPINRESDPRWAVLCEYVRDIADRMGLGRWWLNISHDWDDNDDHKEIATTFVCYQSLEATMHFSDRFFEAVPAKQRLTVTHELIHVIGGGVLAVWNEVRKHTPPVLDTWYVTEEERFTNWLASLTAPSMPLIEWGEDVKSG